MKVLREPLTKKHQYGLTCFLTCFIKLRPLNSCYFDTNHANEGNNEQDLTSMYESHQECTGLDKICKTKPKNYKSMIRKVMAGAEIADLALVLSNILEKYDVIQLKLHSDRVTS